MARSQRQTPSQSDGIGLASQPHLLALVLALQLQLLSELESQLKLQSVLALQL
jgi:hypothetical protein